MSDTHYLKKELFEKLHSDDNLFEFIRSSSLDGLWYWDLENPDEEWMDEQFWKTLGYDPSTMPSKASAWQNIIHPDDLSAAKDIANQHFQHPEIPYDLLVRYTHKKGHTVWIRCRGKAIRDDNGKPIRMLGAHIDVSELKEKEIALTEEKKRLQEIQDELERYKALLEETGREARIGSWEFYPKTNLNVWSKVTEEIHEVDDDFVPHPEKGVLFYKEGFSRDKIIEVFTEAVTKGQNFDEELILVTAKGNEVWVRAMGKAEMIDGQCERVYGTFQDISKQKDLEFELRKAKKHAEKANAAKSQFLANMSHEIRTPLNSVLGFAELLEYTEMSDTQKNYVKAISQSGYNLLDLIDDILDLSKVESGKTILNIEKTDIWDLIERLVETINVKINKSKVEFLVNIDPLVPRLVWVDSIRLRQVLTNLLSNATKFTEQGEIELGMFVTAKDASKCGIEFYVRDTGIGIAKAKQKTIFQEFVQEDSSISKKYGGTGLGLAISNRLLMLMDSQIRLESTLGHGSTFSFPLVVKFEEEEATESYSFQCVKKILVVDDNALNRKLVSNMLTRMDMQVVTVENGIEALNRLNKQKFDVLIIDYQMPYLDGLQTIEQVRTNLKMSEAELSIVMLHSVNDDNLLVSKAKEFSISQIHRKPITSLYLNNMLKAIDANMASSQKAHKPEKGPNLNRKNILLVDDNELNMLLLESLVNTLPGNFNQIKVTNGSAALLEVERQKPDFIFMDINMPGRNGIEVTQILREKYSKEELPIVAVTASVVKGIKDDCLNAGMNDYVSKPLSKLQLQRVFDEYLPLSV